MIFKSHRFISSIFVLVIILISHSLMAQELIVKDLPEISRDSLLSIARTIIDSVRGCTLITIDENGKPQARIMHVFPPEENMVLWLGTNINSRKIKQIKKNPNVMVFYYETKGRSYVSVAGQALIVNDPNKKSQYWKEYWTRFYTDPEKDFILIKVIPERIEICSFKYELFWDSSGKPAFVEF